MQKAYNRTNMLRKISLFVSLGSIIVFFAIFFGFFMSSSKNHPVFESILVSMVVAFMCASILHSLIHGEFAYRYVFKKFSLIVALVISMLVIYPLVAFCGFPLMVIDLVLFIKKKPLVFRFEHKYFFLINSVQQVVLNDAYQLKREEYDREYAMDSMQTLKKCLMTVLLRKMNTMQRKLNYWK